MSNRIGTSLEKGAPKSRGRSLLRSTALSQCGAFLISACTSSNKLTPSYDAGLNDSEFEPRTEEGTSSESLDGINTSQDGDSAEPLDSVDSAATSEPPATEALDRDAGADAGADAG